MDFSNPLEIIIAICLVLFSIWMVERIIAGAFKTVITAIIVMLIFAGVAYHKGSIKTKKNLPHFTLHDLTDWESFKKKAQPYEKETIQDLKESFYGAEKDVKHPKY
jgi:hypothetical protein